MPAIQDILSPVWTFAKSGGGQVIQGLDAIRQCLDVIVTTSKGSDPLRPEFGCDAPKYQDYPVNVAAPLIVKALLDSISTWESRVTVNKITWTLNGTSNLIFHVGYSLTPEIADTLTVKFSGGTVTTNAVPKILIIKGTIPTGDNAGRYTINLILNNQQCYPLAPAIGFADVQSMFDWVTANWGMYGKWFLTHTQIVCQVNNQYISGQITIGYIDGIIYKQIIPQLNAAQMFGVVITVGGISYSPSTLLFTAADILNYVQTEPDLSALGTWTIETSMGDFSNDFNNDYMLNSQILVLLTNVQEPITINITAEDVL